VGWDESFWGVDVCIHRVVSFCNLRAFKFGSLITAKIAIGTN